MTARQTVHRDGDPLVGLDLELVLVNAKGQPSRIPASLADAIRPFLVSPTSPPK